MGRFTKYLNLALPRTGRITRENGEFWNESDGGYLRDLLDTANAVFRKQAFNLANTSDAMATGEDFYWSITTSTTKHTIVYARVFYATEGPMTTDLLFGATYTAGDAVLTPPLFVGSPSADVVVTRAVTGVSGGVVSPVDEIFGAGNNVSVSATAGLPTIFPPNSDFLVRATSGASGSNKLRIDIGFAEIELPDDLP